MCLFFLFAAASASAGTLKDIQDRNTLIVGMDPPYGVMEFFDADDNLVGIDVDISKQIAKSFGVTVEFKTMPFAELFGAIESGTIDVAISAVSITQERQKTMLFSAPYLDASLNAVTREGNDAVNTIDDVKNGRIGVLAGTTGEKFATESALFQTATVVPFTNNDDRMTALAGGDIDVALVHFLTPGAYPVKLLNEPLKQAYYGVVTRLENTELIDRIDRVLRDMKRDGTLQDIQAKYAD